jgi:hypothetical protein
MRVAKKDPGTGDPQTQETKVIARMTVKGDSQQ